MNNQDEARVAQRAGQLMTALGTPLKGVLGTTRAGTTPGYH
jgi:hypothetical protein